MEMQYTIEERDDGEVAVYEIGKYPNSSVLSGQDRKTFIEIYSNEAEALTHYPNATTGYYDPRNHYEGRMYRPEGFWGHEQ